MCVGRELTKLHEEIWRGQSSEAIARFSRRKIKGEVTVIIAGAVSGEARWPEEKVRSALRMELAEDVSLKSATRSVARHSGWSARELYTLVLDDGESLRSS